MYLFIFNFKFNSVLDVSKIYIIYFYYNKIVKYINVLKVSKDCRYEVLISIVSFNEDVGVKRNYCYFGYIENFVVCFVFIIYYV